MIELENDETYVSRHYARMELGELCRCSGEATDWTIRCSNTGKGKKIFRFSKTCRLAVWPTQPHTGSLSWG